MMIVTSLVAITILSPIITITAAHTALVNVINNDNGDDIGKQQRSRKLMLQRRQSRKKHQTYTTSGHKRKLSSWHGPTSDNAVISSDNASSSDNNAMQHNTVMHTKSSKKKLHTRRYWASCLTSLTDCPQDFRRHDSPGEVT